MTEIHSSILCNTIMRPFKHFFQSFGYAHVDFTFAESTRRLSDYLSAMPHRPVTVRMHSILTCSGTADAAIKNGKLFGRTTDILGFDAEGVMVCDWTAVDRVYDFLVNNGYKPIVELCNMPPVLQRPDADYLASDWLKWREFIRAFTGHCLERYGLIDYFVQYYDEYKIDMPADYLQQMTALEARVGRVNITLYDKIIKKRKAAARYYFNNFSDKPEFILPPQVNGATYSHFVVQVKDRNSWLQEGIRKGIQLGWLIEYSIPEMKAYGSHDLAKFPVAGKYSRSTINLPVWGGEKLAGRITRQLDND